MVRRSFALLSSRISLELFESIAVAQINALALCVVLLCDMDDVTLPEMLCRQNAIVENVQWNLSMRSCLAIAGLGFACPVVGNGHLLAVWSVFAPPLSWEQRAFVQKLHLVVATACLCVSSDLHLSAPFF